MRRAQAGDERSFWSRDPSTFATNVQAGAKYGYSLLWIVLLANLVAMLFQGLSAKLGIITGKPCRDMPGRISAADRLGMWIVSEFAAMATDLAEFLGALGPWRAARNDWNRNCGR
jgi:manganese transport protein